MTNNNINQLDKNFDVERKINKKRNVAVIGLIDKDKRILLVRTRRLPGRWQPVGGGIEDNESPIEAIIREVKEEINILINSNNITETAQIPYDFGEGTIYFYESNLNENLNNIKFKEDEILEYGWFLLSNAKELPLFNATAKFIDILIEKDNQ